MASGEYVSTLDSDDAIEENAIELLLEYWNRIPEKERNNYKSITGRVKNGSTGELIGKKNLWEYLDCTSLDARFKYHLEYEKWGLSRLAVLNEFRSPNIKGLHFYPENIVYDAIARKYKERFVEDVVRLYFWIQVIPLIEIRVIDVMKTIIFGNIMSMIFLIISSTIHYYL